MKRDRSIQKETGSSGDNEKAVIERINQLGYDIDYRNKIIYWIRETITARSEGLYSSCVAIIEAGR